MADNQQADGRQGAAKTRSPGVGRDRRPAKTKSTYDGPTVTVEQYASPIRRPADQRATLIGLGLNKIRRRRTLPDTPEVRGMIRKVAHMVRVIEG